MSTDLTEVAQYNAVVPVADNGDAVNAAEKVALAQPLANRAAFFKSVLEGTLSIAQLKEVSDQSAGVLQTITSAVLGNVTALVLSLDVVQNDIVVAWWDQSWQSVAGAEAELEVALLYDGSAMSGGLGADARDPASNNSAKTMQMGLKVVPATGTFDVQAQAAKGSVGANVELLNRHLLLAVVLHPIVITPV